MSASFLVRRALTTRPVAATATAAIARRSFASTPLRCAHDEARAAHEEQKANLQAESKRNPEILILGAIMVCAFAGAGFYFGRSPTASTSQAHVELPDQAMPWESDDESRGKYKYYPGADRHQAPREAPSAINTTIIPDVILPKRLHDQYNKWGKDDA